MSDKIDNGMIEYVGILAKLEFGDAEKEKIRLDMEKMLDYVDMLNELDTADVEPLVQVIDTGNVFREDEITNPDDREAMLANAPEKKDGQYVVPHTFD